MTTEKNHTDKSISTCCFFKFILCRKSFDCANISKRMCAYNDNIKLLKRIYSKAQFNLCTNTI